MSILKDAKQLAQGAMHEAMARAVALAPDSWIPGGEPERIIARVEAGPQGCDTRSLSALGITLLGRITDVTAGGTLVIADDLAANGAYADMVSAAIRSEIDDYIARQGLDAEPVTVDPAEAMSGRFPTATVLPDLPDADVLIADKGYDSDWFRQALTGLEIEPCIPGRANRKAPILYDADL